METTQARALIRAGRAARPIITFPVSVPSSTETISDLIAGPVYADAAMLPLPCTDRSSSAHFDWLNRPRRILLVVAAMWVLNLFDLGFTLAESAHHHFVEMNPIAAKLLNGPTYGLVAYKFSLLAVGTVILLWLRYHTITELGAWFLLATSTYVGVRWYVYFKCLYAQDINPVVMMLALGG